MEENIYVTKPSLPPLEEYVEYLKEIWSSSNLTNMGKFWQQFTKQLSEFMNAEYLLPMCNGHMSLELAIQAFDLKGEVITTPFTFASTTHAIVRNNLTPVFCDIRESDCTIDPDKIEALITDKTCAIVPVHVYGMPCDVAKIKAIAQKHDLKVIYDAAHAFGETVNGESISKFGDASMFSFHATKCFNSIEGGCVVTNNKDILHRLYQLHNFGIMGEESIEYVGANAKMNEFQSAMGICNLQFFGENRNKRREIFHIYRDHLSRIEGIKILNYDEEKVNYNYSYMPIFIDDDNYYYNRNQIQEYLAREHIFTRKYFYPLTSKFKCYENCSFKADTPVAEKMSKQVITLPIYADLAPEKVVTICNILQGLY